MSYTGRYKYNPKTGEVEKISDEIPNVCVFDCYVPEGGYYSSNLETFVGSRRDKRQILKEKGLREVGDA